MILRKLSFTSKTINLLSNNKPPQLMSKILYNQSSISQWVRKLMNRIRFEDNRAIESRQDKLTIQRAQTPKEMEDKFISEEQYKSVVEKQRMQKLDEALGTRTYFHQTKIYQERIDSDHVMEIQELYKKHRQKRRKDLNWQNPQAVPQYKVKSTKKFYKNLANLRQYPKHHQKIINFADQKSQENIQFLGKESLYTKLSLKWVDTYQKSVQNQIIEDAEYQFQSQRFSEKYAYFSTIFQEAKVYRVPSKKFTPNILNSLKAFQEVQSQIEEVISLDQVYEVLKQHFHDERVSEWLKKVQNGQISYLISGYKTTKMEDKIIFWIDLLGTKKQYVFLYKSFDKKISNNGQTEKNIQQSHKNNDQNQIVQNKLSTNLIFNCKPVAIFSENGESIYLVQRSQQGGYIQLINVKILDENNLGQAQILYKCKSYEQLSIFTDQTNKYLFVKINEYGEYYSQKILILEQKNDGSQERDLIQLDLQGKNLQKEGTKKDSAKSDKPEKYRLLIQWCSQGLIISKLFSSIDKHFEYGSNIQYGTKVQLIPYKSHIQMINQSTKRTQIQYQLPEAVKSKRQKISANELDFGKRVSLYQCTSEQFITEVSVRQSHIVLALSTKSVYNKKRICFLPYQNSKNPHSLVFEVQNLNLLNLGYNYSSQIVNFSINRSIIFNQYYQYTIWKKQLKQLTHDKIHIQKIRLNPNIQLTMTCLSKSLQHLPKYFLEKTEDDSFEQKQPQYQMENSKVPILIYLTDNKDFSLNAATNKVQRKKNQLNIRKFLQKGTIVITVSCRGTLFSDLIQFHQGSSENFDQMLDDIEESIQWIGNNLGSNISLYAKGNISGLAGMLLNVQYPFLFTSTVLHDGCYEFIDDKLSNQSIQYFFRFGKQSFKNRTSLKFWKLFNPGSFNFKESKLPQKSSQQSDQQSNQSQNEEIAYEQQQVFLKSEQQQKISQNNKQKEIQNIDASQLKMKKILQDRQLPKIGTLQNVLISCKQKQYNKVQARRMIYKLRRNQLKYSQVYLKQFLIEQDEELFNLSYIYGKMKERLEYEGKN